VSGAGGAAGARAGFSGGGDGGFDLLAAASVDLASLRDGDFAALPEPRFRPLVRSQLYAAGSPYDCGAAANVCAVLGGNPLFWPLPLPWGVQERPPYAVSGRFAEFRRRMAVRDGWRASHPAEAARLDAAWTLLHRPGHAGAAALPRLPEEEEGEGGTAAASAGSAVPAEAEARGSGALDGEESPPLTQPRV